MGSNTTRVKEGRIFVGLKLVNFEKRLVKNDAPFRVLLDNMTIRSATRKSKDAIPKQCITVQNSPRIFGFSF